VKIGLSYTGNDDKHNNYVQWLRSGDDIEVVKLSYNEKDKNLIEECDALVLSGGLDMHPKYYNGNADYPDMPENGFDIERDEFELSLLNKAINNSIPVLGICRGMQLINTFYHGTMVQHLLEDKILHKGSPDKKHNVGIEDGSLLYEIAGVKSETVNSAHHQSIGLLGEGIAGNS
jgi:putative glutamine amidotransferase